MARLCPVLIQNMLADDFVERGQFGVVFQKGHVAVECFEVAPAGRAGLRLGGGKALEFVKGLAQERGQQIFGQLLVLQNLVTDGEHVVGEVGRKHGCYVQGQPLLRKNALHAVADGAGHVCQDLQRFLLQGFNENGGGAQLHFLGFGERLQRIKNGCVGGCGKLQHVQWLAAGGVNENGLVRQDHFAGHFGQRIITHGHDEQARGAGGEIERGLYFGLVEAVGERFGMLGMAAEHFLYHMPGIVKGGGEVPGYISGANKGYVHLELVT